MVNYSLLTINAADFSNFKYGNVINNIGENNASSSFSVTYTNHNGRYSSSFNIGDNVKIYIGSTAPANTIIFNGIIENVKISGGNNNISLLTITGRDYAALLQDITIPPEIYTDKEISHIVIDIMTKYCPDIATTNVNVTDVTIDREVFNQVSIFDALKRLANYCNFNFWVDTDKVLNFTVKGSSSSGYTFNSTNITKSSWIESRKDLANYVWVYGDLYQSGWQEYFTADGIGSVFTLAYNPSSTLVGLSGGSITYRGGVDNMTVSDLSGVQYLVNYHNKQIIFTSGTDAGANIPASGENIFIGYDRSLPIIKFGRDRISKNIYGQKNKVINDNSIKDPNSAQARLKTELLNSNPKTQGDIDVDGSYTITAGQTCIVDMPQDGIDLKTYDIIEVKYSLIKENMLAENVMSLKLNKRLGDITDSVKRLVEEMKKIQAGNMDTTQTYTRSEFTDASLRLAANWQLSFRDVGSSIVFDSAAKFFWDSQLPAGSKYFDAINDTDWIVQQVGASKQTFVERFRNDDLKISPTTAEWDTTVGKLLMSSLTNHMQIYNNVATTTSIVLNRGVVNKATISAVETKWGFDQIQYYLSADGGANWEECFLNTEHTFVNVGEDLRARILFFGNGANETYVQDFEVKYVI